MSNFHISTQISNCRKLRVLMCIFLGLKNCDRVFFFKQISSLAGVGVKFISGDILRNLNAKQSPLSSNPIETFVRVLRHNDAAESEK